MTHPILGPMTPDPVGIALGTGMMRFSSPFGIDGLARERDNAGRLDVLAVVATQQGTGQFREFIRQAQAHYRVIFVMHDDNPLVGTALARYGFGRAVELESDGEVVPGWMWEKNS